MYVWVYVAVHCAYLHHAHTCICVKYMSKLEAKIMAMSNTRRDLDRQQRATKMLERRWRRLDKLKVYRQLE